jgi:hypothetical protein
MPRASASENLYFWCSTCIHTVVVSVIIIVTIVITNHDDDHDHHDDGIIAVIITIITWSRPQYLRLWMFFSSPRRLKKSFEYLPDSASFLGYFPDEQTRHRSKHRGASNAHHTITGQTSTPPKLSGLIVSQSSWSHSFETRMTLPSRTLT